VAVLSHHPSALRHTPSPSSSSSNLACSSTHSWNEKGFNTNPAHPSENDVLDELARDNALLRHDIEQKNDVIESLRNQVTVLQLQVAELKQLPVGKISQIPVNDMVELMQTFGSEVSDHTHLPASFCSSSSAKPNIQKASIVRQFRRWNPNFHEFFEHKAGAWVPKLGMQAELLRRAQSRAQRRQPKAAAPRTVHQHKKQKKDHNKRSS
jgi:hypothetical protein